MSLLLDARNIHPLTDFIRNHKTHLQRLKETKKPEVLTVNGKAELVLLDVESYQEIIDQLESADLIAAVREGLVSIDQGAKKPLAQMIAEKKTK